MIRNVFLVSLMLLLAQAGFAVPAHAAEFASIAYAEQPVRMLRDKTFYLASRGARLQTGDLIESGAATIQLTGWGASTVALGPASRLYLTTGPGGADYLLLSGWMKLQTRAEKDALPTTAGTAAIRFDPAGASVILRAGPGKSELFVESGVVGVDDLDAGKAVRRTTVTREHYALRSGGEPLKVAARPAKDFLGAMPRVFFDALVAVRAKVAVTEPKLDRVAAFADVAPWLSDHPELRLAMQRRFQPPRQPPSPAQQPVRNIIY